jgi:hypothetical protein
LASLIPCSRNLGRSFIAYFSPKLQEAKLTFLTPESSPVARSIILILEYEIQVAEESEAELRQWKVEEISQGDITDPFVGYIRQITDCSVLLKF